MKIYDILLGIGFIGVAAMCINNLFDFEILKHIGAIGMATPIIGWICMPDSMNDKPLN